MVAGLTGAILAAGRGERLRASIGGIPKPLAIIDGETLLARQVRRMLEVGASRVIAIINSETAAVMRQREVKAPPELELLVRDTPNSLESLLALGERITSDRFLLATVDAVVDKREFDRFVPRAMELTEPSGVYKLDGTLAVVRWRGDRHPLFVELAPDGLIRRLGDGQSALVTAGLYTFSTRIFDYAVAARMAKLDAMRRYLSMLVEDGMRLAGIELRQAIDVDEGTDLEAARMMLGRSGTNQTG
ncbi:MAG: NTP transferase domain-containing protein [Candidatus Binataceae bacterium]